MSDIAKAREIILEVRAQIEAGTMDKDNAVAKLSIAERMMHREPPAKKRAKPSGKKVDAKLAQMIREFAAEYPEHSEFAIARIFKLGSQGRVSEALNYKR